MKEESTNRSCGSDRLRRRGAGRLLLHHPRLKGTPPVFAGRVDAKDAARGGVPLPRFIRSWRTATAAAI
jgi:hypothetical protein